VKVFFPSHCLSKTSGFIFGWKITQENSFVAATIVCLPKNSTNLYALWESCSGLSCEPDSGSLSLLGIWLNGNREQCISEVWNSAKATLLTGEMIVLHLSENSLVPRLYFVGDKLRMDGSVIVLYKQPSGNTFLTARASNVSTSDFWRQSLNQEQIPCTELSEVLILINTSHNEEARIRTLMETKDHSLSGSSVNFFFGLVLKAIRKACGVFSERSTVKHSRISAEIVKFLSSLSAVFLQSHVRFSQVKALCTCVVQSRAMKDEQDVNSSVSSNSSKKASRSKEKHSVFPVVWFGSLVVAVSIDIVLGLLIVSWLFSNGYNMRATDFMMEKTDSVVEFLSALLDWLKGAPAGLKLNKHLAEYLSTFFLYHVYLWQIYLSSIEPYLQIIASLIIMSGCFGLTFLLSLVSDVLSVVTLHSYCFYVYAARLYNFQLKKLIALFRLFTGRKWNVEKNQVDIVPYKADRLFLGTLCFTVLLFLLPTTAMYYGVFTILRLIMLFVKGVITRAIDTMNNLPAFPLTIACVRPDLIPGGVKFELLDSSECPGEEELNRLQCFSKDVTGPVPSVCLALHNQSLPITKLLYTKLIDGVADHGGYKLSWPSLLGKLAKGELIYPWVKPRNSK